MSYLYPCKPHAMLTRHRDAAPEQTPAYCPAMFGTGRGLAAKDLPEGKAAGNRERRGGLFPAGDQFFRLWMGAGMRPPRPMKAVASPRGTGMMAALPSRPPKETSSPTPLPGTGMTRTAVVL